MLKINEYMYGNKKYCDSFVLENKDTLENLSETGQSPQALFIGCVDSRVLPNLMTDTGPGDLLIHRNVGNFVPPLESDYAGEAVASVLEFAVKVLSVEAIIVCGHTKCGAIYTIFSDLDRQSFPALSGWLEQGQMLKELFSNEMHRFGTKEEMLREAEKASVKQQLDNLMTYPFIRERVEEKRLELLGWMYDIQTGAITYYDSENDLFRMVDGEVQNEKR